MVLTIMSLWFVKKGHSLLFKEKGMCVCILLVVCKSLFWWIFSFTCLLGANSHFIEAY